MTARYGDVTQMTTSDFSADASQTVLSEMSGRNTRGKRIVTLRVQSGLRMRIPAQGLKQIILTPFLPQFLRSRPAGGVTQEPYTGARRNRGAYLCHCATGRDSGAPLR